MSDIEKIYTFLSNADLVKVDGKEVDLAGMEFVANRICFPSSVVNEGEVKTINAVMENGESLTIKGTIESVSRKSMLEKLGGGYTTLTHLDAAFSSGAVMEF